MKWDWMLGLLCMLRDKILVGEANHPDNEARGKLLSTFVDTSFKMHGN